MAHNDTGGGLMGVGYVKDALDKKWTSELEADKEKKKRQTSAIRK